MINQKPTNLPVWCSLKAIPFRKHAINLSPSEEFLSSQKTLYSFLIKFKGGPSTSWPSRILNASRSVNSNGVGCCGLWKIEAMIVKIRKCFESGKFLCNILTLPRRIFENKRTEEDLEILSTKLKFSIEKNSPSIKISFFSFWLFPDHWGSSLRKSKSGQWLVFRSRTHFRHGWCRSLNGR